MVKKLIENMKIKDIFLLLKLLIRSKYKIERKTKSLIDLIPQGLTTF